MESKYKTIKIDLSDLNDEYRYIFTEKIKCDIDSFKVLLFESLIFKGEVKVALMMDIRLKEVFFQTPLFFDCSSVSFYGKTISLHSEAYNKILNDVVCAKIENEIANYKTTIQQA